MKGTPVTIDLSTIRLAKGKHAKPEDGLCLLELVAFAFSKLLGFELLPRLKAIHAQKLYRPDTGQPDAYPNLQPILTRSINWALIREQYDEMVKYATALRLGTAETGPSCAGSRATICNTVRIGR